MSSARAYVLDGDVELAELVPRELRDAARQASLTTVVDVPAGRWNARREADRARDGYGLLVLEGVLIRRVGSAGRFGAELLGPGDLLRPWEFDGEDPLGFETGWRVLVGTRLAVLDLTWTERMARYPKVGPALAGRALGRSRRVTAMMAIAQQPRLDVRLWMLFWELADRYGRVHSDGVHVGSADQARRAGPAEPQRPRLGAPRQAARVVAARAGSSRRRTSTALGGEAGDREFRAISGGPATRFARYCSRRGVSCDRRAAGGRSRTLFPLAASLPAQLTFRSLDTDCRIMEQFAS